MQRINSPPKMNVILLFSLTAVTWGIFAPVWFLRKKDWLNRLSATKKLGSRLPIFVAITYGISAIMLFAPAFEAWDEIDDLISSVGLFIIIILAFQFRKILTQHYIDKLGMNIGFSGLGTFFFHIFYLQYKINRLPVSAEP